MSVGIDDLVKESEWQPTSATATNFVPSLVCNETACTNETGLDGVTTEPPNEELDTTKVVVLTTIIVLTVLGNVAVILAIICRKMKMNRYDNRTRLFFSIIYCYNSGPCNICH